MKVLVIEDDTHLRSDLIEILGFEGYAALGAENGHDGLLLAQEHRPNLIICDITMPVLDGFGVIAALREDLQTADIPVIFLSARSEQHFVQKGLQLGAAAYVSKPYDPKDLLAAVQAQIGD
jgi:DNA-binding response OmpR family regulator